MNVAALKPVKIIAVLLIAAGALMVVAGAATWTTVRAQLAAENITIPEDGLAFAGNTVDGPIDAFIQAEVINRHALAGTDGATYAELDREDPRRAMIMNGSFLRASLFTSVIAFGIAAFAAGMGVLMIGTGVALRQITVAAAPVAAAPGTREPVTV